MKSNSIRSVLFFLASFTTFFLTIYAYGDNSNSKQYMAMVDIGSSGSRIYLYKFEQFDKIKPPLLTEIELKDNSVNPGFNELADRVSKVGEYFDPMFKSLEKGMAEHNLSYKDLEFHGYGTAGLRILSPYQRDALLNELKKICTQKGFSTVETRVLEGHEEGLYDWITVNYLENSFAENKQTYCILDLGGGSAEIAYEVNGFYPNTYVVKIANKSFKVYSRSFLGLGMDFVRYQVTELPYCWQAGYDMPTESQTANPDFFKGVDEISILITLAETSEGSLTPDIPPNMNIIGLGGYYYLTTDKPLHLSKDYTINNLVNAGTNLSKESWQKMLEQYKQNAYSFEYLFAAEYITALLKNGFHFNNAQVIHARDTIAGMDSDWTLGAALYIYEGNGKL